MSTNRLRTVYRALAALFIFTSVIDGLALLARIASDIENRPTACVVADGTLFCVPVPRVPASPAATAPAPHATAAPRSESL